MLLFPSSRQTTQTRLRGGSCTSDPTEAASLTLPEANGELGGLFWWPEKKSSFTVNPKFLNSSIDPPQNSPGIQIRHKNEEKMCLLARICPSQPFS